MQDTHVPQTLTSQAKPAPPTCLPPWGRGLIESVVWPAEMTQPETVLALVPVPTT